MNRFTVDAGVCSRFLSITYLNLELPYTTLKSGSPATAYPKIARLPDCGISLSILGTDQDNLDEYADNGLQNQLVPEDYSAISHMITVYGEIAILNRP
jgi:hypothetical protein